MFSDKKSHRRKENNVKIDFWENYNEPGKEPGDDKLIREIDKIRFDAWVKANNLKPEETAWSAENFNKMEEWYLNLASAWQEVKDEIRLIDTSMVCELMLKSKVLEIIDEHLQEKDPYTDCSRCMYYATCDKHNGCSLYEAWY